MGDYLKLATTIDEQIVRLQRRNLHIPLAEAQSNKANQLRCQSTFFVI